MIDRPLRELYGHRANRDFWVVTGRGILHPIGNAHPDWTVTMFLRLLGQIDAVPETAERGPA